MFLFSTATVRFVISSLLISVFFGSQAWACPKPITISYGPYVSLLTIKHNFGHIHEELARQTDCPVEYILYSNFDHYINSLVRQKHTITFVPKVYMSGLNELGYGFVSRLIQPDKLLRIIVRRESGVHSIKDLGGKKILALSPFSGSGARLLEKLSEHEILSRVKVEYGGNYESMLFSVIQGKADATIVVPQYWNIFDKRVREKYLKVIYSIPVGSPHYAILGEHEELGGILKGVLNNESVLKWGKPEEVKNTVPSLHNLFMRRYQALNSVKN